MTATLWLIPLPLGSQSPATDVLPAATLLQIDPLKHFVVETAKVARAFLKPLLQGPLVERHWYELNQRTPPAAIATMLAPLLLGEDVGLLSDAGCPGIADPGAALVLAVHQAIAGGAHIKIRPLIGPSSITLALMASGMNGQSFAFVGYLPSEPEMRKKALAQMENRSRLNKETILMIETPYRSKAFLESALSTLNSNTRFLSAAQLSLPDESIVCRTIAQWQKIGLNKAVAQQLAEPCVFALLA
jgi:16S rRNA (cytidine1402-2'-O)-methyltransferase